MEESLLDLKPMYFVVEAVRDDLLEMPLSVRKEFGHALYMAQRGAAHQNAKRLQGLGSGTMEVVENYVGDTYRAVYTVRFEEAIYVLHVFQKKSTRGIKTPQREMDIIQARLRRAQQLHEDYLEKQALEANIQEEKK